jgi:hypothetical protein
VQVVKDGRGQLGLVDFATLEDMQTALRRLDGSEFKNPFDTTTIYVKEDRGGGGGGGRDDRDRDRDRDDRGRDDRRRSRSRWEWGYIRHAGGL